MTRGAAASDAIEEAARRLGLEVDRTFVNDRGHSGNLLARVLTRSGARQFLKVAVDEQTGAWLRAEHRFYDALGARGFLPRVLGWDPADPPVLALEDLSEHTWPPPWSSENTKAVRDALGEIASIAPPPGLPRLRDQQDLSSGWASVAGDPEPFLALGLAGEAWLDRHLSTLQAHSRPEALDGDALVHGDVRSDNLCIRDGGCVLFDWNYAASGSPDFDLVTWLPSLALEGGPVPWEVLRDERPAMIASMFAGYLAARAGTPAPTADSGVRELQAAQLAVLLDDVLPRAGVAERPVRPSA